jgi:PAS domain S-box-containing protein
MIINIGGPIVSVNRAFEEITGYSREELIGNSCRILDCDTCRQEEQEQEATDICPAPQREATQHQCRIRRKDGSLVHALKNTALLRDGSNNTIGMVAAITGQKKQPLPAKRAASNLQEIERQELLEALDTCNGNQSQAARMLGISRVTVLNRIKRHHISPRR